MKRINLILLLLAIMSVKLTAQVNPQKGYIITNNNDTIHGTIDYLTDAQNALVKLVTLLVSNVLISNSSNETIP